MPQVCEYKGRVRDYTGQDGQGCYYKGKVRDYKGEVREYKRRFVITREGVRVQQKVREYNSRVVLTREGL